MFVACASSPPPVGRLAPSFAILLLGRFSPPGQSAQAARSGFWRAKVVPCLGGRRTGTKLDGDHMPWMGIFGGTTSIFRIWVNIRWSVWDPMMPRGASWFSLVRELKKKGAESNRPGKRSLISRDPLGGPFEEAEVLFQPPNIWRFISWGSSRMLKDVKIGRGGGSKYITMTTVLLIGYS